MQSRLQQLKERILSLLILQVRKHIGLVAFSCVMLSGFVSIVSLFLVRSWRIDKNLIPNVAAQLQIGYREDKESEYFYFERPEEEAKIKPIINNLPSGLFYLVTGPEGSGKTSVIKHCIRDKQGVFYFSSPSDPKDFCSQFVKALHYDLTPSNLFQEYLSKFRVADPAHHSSLLNVTLDALSKASSFFKSYHLYSPTLIIDNFLALAHDSHTFDRLVSFAKEEADAKRLIVVFVASTSPVDIVRKISERSRLEIIEIEDLSQENAKRFFNFHVKEESVDDVVNVTGGRMIHLVKAIDMFRKKRVESADELKARFMEEAYNKLVETNLIIPPKKMEKDQEHSVLTQYLKKGVTTIMKILDSPSKSISYRELIHDLGDTSSLLLFNGKIFFRSHSRNQVKLESRALELCVGEMMGERDTQLRREFATIFLPPPNE